MLFCLYQGGVIETNVFTLKQPGTEIVVMVKIFLTFSSLPELA